MCAKNAENRLKTGTLQASADKNKSLSLSLSLSFSLSHYFVGNLFVFLQLDCTL